MPAQDQQRGRRVQTLAPLELDELGIGEQRALAAQDRVVILARQREEPRAVEVVELAPDGIDAVHRDRRLGVLGAVGCAARVRQVEAVDLDDHHAAAARLLDDVGLERVVEREFLHLQSELLEEILQRELGEGEVVALEILGGGEAQRRGGILVQRVEDLDPDVDVAVGLRPVARAGMQRVRHVARRRKRGQDGDRRLCEHRR